MAEIINLKRARKAKSRAEKDKVAQANRVAHGTPKALRKLTGAQDEKAARVHDGKRLAPEDES